jgi:hypothetical protein
MYDFSFVLVEFVVLVLPVSFPVATDVTTNSARDDADSIAILH